MVRLPLSIELQNSRRRRLLHNILVRVDQKSARARRQVADAFTRLGVEHLHHHADDMPRRAELSIAPRDAQMTQQILEQIALHILILLADLHLVDQVHRLHQQARLIDLALRPAHILTKGRLIFRDCYAH